jgi:hypothetical protein
MAFLTRMCSTGVVPSLLSSIYLSRASVWTFLPAPLRLTDDQFLESLALSLDGSLELFRLLS